VGEKMSVHICESIIYGSSWGAPEIRQLFEEQTRVEEWLRILSLLAETQAEYGLIPEQAAAEIKETCGKILVDDAFLTEIKNDFILSNHSFIGIIRAVQKRCGKLGGEWFCYGATVQDITDTQLMCALVKVREHLLRELEKLEALLSGLAKKYKKAYMLGRTHGQSGLPITFGYKVACWLDELHRHRNRLDEVGARMTVGQLCGGVGSMSSYGPNAPQIQAKLLRRLGLCTPTISWISARDRLAEWMNLMALIASTGDRIGHEIYNLQRREIAEVREGCVNGTIGSITMPHKRNPEISEHLGTLARVVRHEAAHMLENLVHDHERDGRSWKGEWWVVPPACMVTSKIVSLLINLFSNLEIDEQRMLSNINSEGGSIFAESIMLALAPKIGKQSAHQLLYDISRESDESGADFKTVLFRNPQYQAYFSQDDIEELFNLEKSAGHCSFMVDLVLEKVNDA
jgi:adenylosuccinate lyase